MPKDKRQSICAFIHYSEKEEIPYYDEVYINELSRFFDEVKVITNERPGLNPEVLSSNVTIQFEKNEGYDFGLFYKFFRSVNKSKYHTIACINDSNLLVNNLDVVFMWGEKQGTDFWGIIDSEEKPWFSEHKDNHHLQSHFLIFRDNAINKLEEYINKLNVVQLFSIEDKKELRRRIINDWEIGLSVFFRKEGIPLKSYLKSNEFNKIHNKKVEANPMHKLPKELLKNSFPLIKKKMLKEKLTRRFARAKHWEMLMEQYSNKECNLNLMIQELLIP